ncbi:hypothetical protein ACFXKD_27935 [Nocardiopsis aegyptia]|uniref:hypothetical protein n=1 Tax=Nocardiopsis aegyptia TaxID=220378 RepID=UPI00366BBDBF
MRYLNPSALLAARFMAKEATRRPRRASRPRRYAPWPPLVTGDMAVLHAVRAGLENLAVAR